MIKKGRLEKFTIRECNLKAGEAGKDTCCPASKIRTLSRLVFPLFTAVFTGDHGIENAIFSQE
jgi:hypothetical protein